MSVFALRRSYLIPAAHGSDGRAGWSPLRDDDAEAAGPDDWSSIDRARWTLPPIAAKVSALRACRSLRQPCAPTVEVWARSTQSLGFAPCSPFRALANSEPRVDRHGRSPESGWFRPVTSRRSA